jgi:uncharacterized membrane-anchored protein YhcB (DUF1043 family)
MDWLIGVLLLVVGGIIGFFVAKFVSAKHSSSTESESGEQTTRELMTEQANSYLHESKQIVQQIENQSQALKQQLEAYEALLTVLPETDETSGHHYFGEHAATYLRHKSAKQIRSKSSSGVQPLDFSSQSSGLFSGDKNNKVDESK